jgi:DNA repair exonuclease SbcCD ATPase subunit
MSTFHITKIDNFKNYSFGECLIDIATALSLPTPFIRGSEMTKLHKKGIWVIHIMQPGCEIEPKTKKIKFKTFHTNKKIGAQLLMQEMIARLCGRHFFELQNHYSHLYGRHDEEGMVIRLTDSEQDPMRTHLAELEYLIRDVDVERYNELFNNDELCAQLAEEDKQHLEQEEKIKEMKEKIETQEKQRKSQEKRIQARNKDVRELKQKIECNDFELEADHDLIEKLRADKKELQEKVDTLTEELQDYKRLLKENGFDVEEVEVAMEE